jgi:hypothetical protein
MISYKDFKNLKFQKFTVGVFPLHIYWNNIIKLLDSLAFSFDVKFIYFNTQWRNGV